MNRRQFILLVVAVLLGVDFGLGHFWGTAGRPAGWRVERWQAGFGSWAYGGYGVAYTLAMPDTYHFAQKCGMAWITRDGAPDDFSIRLAFKPRPGEIMDDVNDFMKNDALHAADLWQAEPAAIVTGGTANVRIGALTFARTALTLKNADLREDDSAAPHRGAVYAAYLTGNKLSAIVDFDRQEPFATSQRILGTLRPARGIGIVDLLLGLPSLFGC